ncbi:MAG: hypothetical protein FWG65_03565 [Turicibacter sp.]|nr:hypothetical protein [Turicibacter sp.]
MRKLVLLLLLAFVGCSDDAEQNSPSETMSIFLEYMTTAQFTEAQAMLIGDFSLYEIEEEYRGVFSELTYEIISETIDDESAYVELALDTIDFAAVMEEVMSNAFSLVFLDISAEEFAREVETLLQNVLESPPTTTINATIELQLHEEWRIVANSYFADAITGGLLSFAESISEWLE